jgi:hypothetical protein
MAICACCQSSPNIIRANSLLRSEGGIWAMALPRSFSFSTTVPTPFPVMDQPTV